MAHFLYIAELVGYAKIGPTKFGISKNPQRRLRGICFEGRTPRLVATIEFASCAEAKTVELALIHTFTGIGNKREYVKEPYDLVIRAAEGYSRRKAVLS